MQHRIVPIAVYFGCEVAQQECTLAAGASRYPRTAACNVCYFCDIWTLIAQIWKTTSSRKDRCTSIKPSSTKWHKRRVADHVRFAADVEWIFKKTLINFGVICQKNISDNPQLLAIVLQDTYRVLLVDWKVVLLFSYSQKKQFSKTNIEKFMNFRSSADELYVTISVELADDHFCVDLT